jgi:hypothetical protein
MKQAFVIISKAFIEFTLGKKISNKLREYQMMLHRDFIFASKQLR